MDFDKVIADTVGAIITSLAQRTTSITADKVKEMITRLADRDQDFKRHMNVPELIRKIGDDSGGADEDAYNEDKLARYLEIPVRDLATLNPDTIEIDVIYNHVKLEKLFKLWLEEWGYTVEIGPTLKGLEGIEYVPDVYATLANVHDSYEVCINYV